MDREWGSKPGSGGAASAQNEAIDRRERLRRLALETIDLAKDPYFMRNHLGSYECKLCLTLHNNEGNYLAHTQGKRHQTNLAKRAAREAKDAPAQPQPNKRKLAPRKSVKIGRPGYKVTKQYDPETKQHSFLFEIGYPEIEDNCKPRHRFMSSYEQKVQSWDKRYQYLLFAADPYEIIAFKIPSTEIDKSASKFFSYWDPDKKEYLPRPPEGSKPPPAPPGTLPNGTGAPGAPPRPPGQAPPPPPPQIPPPPPAPMGMPPRIPPPPIGAVQPPPPPARVANGLRPMIPPPPNFTPGAPPPRPPMQGFPGQQQ
uniref:Splicing factor 3a subunit 2 n=1 Tax=Zea mays TaxID=4577 RepID=A0A804LHJ4_MAIZE